MKKVLVFSMLCIISLVINAQEYVDLGLPSGTFWKSANEKGVYTYEEAVGKFGNKLPTKEQWAELIGMCTWAWTGKGYKVTGDNGNFIVIPAMGFSWCDGGMSHVGTCGSYWSSTSNDLDDAWGLGFNSLDTGGMYRKLRCEGQSVRLVQD